MRFLMCDLNVSGVGYVPLPNIESQSSNPHQPMIDALIETLNIPDSLQEKFASLVSQEPLTIDELKSVLQDEAMGDHQWTDGALETMFAIKTQARPPSQSAEFYFFNNDVSNGITLEQFNNFVTTQVVRYKNATGDSKAWYQYDEFNIVPIGETQKTSIQQKVSENPDFYKSELGLSKYFIGNQPQGNNIDFFIIDLIKAVDAKNGNTAIYDKYFPPNGNEPYRVFDTARWTEFLGDTKLFPGNGAAQSRSVSGGSQLSSEAINQEVVAAERALTDENDRYLLDAEDFEARLDRYDAAIARLPDGPTKTERASEVLQLRLYHITNKSEKTGNLPEVSAYNTFLKNDEYCYTDDITKERQPKGAFVEKNNNLIVAANVAIDNLQIECTREYLDLLSNNSNIFIADNKHVFTDTYSEIPLESGESIEVTWADFLVSRFEDYISSFTSDGIFSETELNDIDKLIKVYNGFVSLGLMDAEKIQELELLKVKGLLSQMIGAIDDTNNEEIPTQQAYEEMVDEFIRIFSNTIPEEGTPAITQEQIITTNGMEDTPETRLILAMNGVPPEGIPAKSKAEIIEETRNELLGAYTSAISRREAGQQEISEVNNEEDTPQNITFDNATAIQSPQNSNLLSSAGKEILLRVTETPVFGDRTYTEGEYLRNIFELSLLKKEDSGNYLKQFQIGTTTNQFTGAQSPFMLSMAVKEALDNYRQSANCDWNLIVNVYNDLISLGIVKLDAELLVLLGNKVQEKEGKLEVVTLNVGSSSAGGAAAVSANNVASAPSTLPPGFNPTGDTITNAPDITVHGNGNQVYLRQNGQNIGPFTYNRTAKRVSELIEIDGKNYILQANTNGNPWTWTFVPESQGTQVSAPVSRPAAGQVQSLAISAQINNKTVTISGFDARLSEATKFIQIDGQEFALGTWVSGKNGRRFTYSDGKTYILRYESGWKIEEYSTASQAPAVAQAPASQSRQSNQIANVQEIAPQSQDFEGFFGGL